MNYNKPRVSIGMPVYNGEAFLKEAIDSILAQTFEDFELIISDNASTDGTQEICEAYAAADRRIRYYRNERNIGGARNFNRVFELATGEYFKWAAHDDICAPEFLKRCVDVLEQNPSVVLCYAKIKHVDEHGIVLDENLDEIIQIDSAEPQVRFHNLINKSFTKVHRGQQLYGVVRASTLAITPLLGSYSGSDLVLLARLALLSQFHEIPEYLFFNRNHRQRASQALSSPYLLTTWFDPTKEGKLVFPKWRIFFEYLHSVNHVPLSLHERIHCYIHLGNWLSKHWDIMVKEVLKVPVWPIYFSIHRRASFEKLKQV